MPSSAIKHQLTCPFEITSGSFLIGRRRILVIPRNHLVEFDAEFDREIQSLTFPGNKATDQNKLDNCEEYKNLNQIFAETSLIRLVLGDIACKKLQ